jgi:hypothetical protein
MKFLFIFILNLSLLTLASANDSMTVTKTEDGVSVSLMDINSTKLGPLFPAYNEHNLLVRLSEEEDISFRCTKRLSITLCTFTFVRSQNVDIGTKLSKIYVEFTEKSVLKPNNDIRIFFKNAKRETFDLEITSDYFAAKITNQ